MYQISCNLEIIGSLITYQKNKEPLILHTSQLKKCNFTFFNFDKYLIGGYVCKVNLLYTCVILGLKYRKFGEVL